MGQCARVVMALAASIGLASAAVGAPPGGVEVCHRPPGGPANYGTITVGPNALDEHLAHGDLPGACSTQCQALCDDGDLCSTDSGVWDTATERCTCSNPPVVCTPLDQCHEAGLCEAATGACTNPPKPDDTPCDDGDAGTILEQCQAGACTGGIAPHESCRQIRDASPGSPDGIYTVLLPPAATRKVYCDMSTDGGGWTASFIGKNGSPNVFDHFDSGAYTGLFDDPTSDEYLQRAPAWLGETASELAVSCGSAMVKFALTTGARNWLVDGTQSGWQALTPTVVLGAVPDVPSSLYTGAGTDTSFVFTRNQSFNATFASSYGGSTAWDRCNAFADTTSRALVFYREGALAPVLNTPAEALSSCAAILSANPSTGDGVYWLVEPGGTPYTAYCDMTTDGGGWTAVFAGRNGSVNVFGHFDAPGYVETCTDPATRCLRRAPASLAAATELAVSCAGAMVRFPLTSPVRAWLSAGTKANWQPLVPAVIAGNVPFAPNWLFTGSGAASSFIFTRDQATVRTFASSQDFDSDFDWCNAVPDQASLTRVFYR